MPDWGGECLPSSPLRSSTTWDTTPPPLPPPPSGYCIPSCVFVCLFIVCVFVDVYCLYLDVHFWLRILFLSYFLCCKILTFLFLLFIFSCVCFHYLLLPIFVFCFYLPVFAAHFCILILQVVFVNAGHLVVITVSQSLEELMSDPSAVYRYVRIYAANVICRHEL